MGQSQSATTTANVVPLVSGVVNLLQGPPPEQNGALHRWKVAVPEEGSCSSQWDNNFHSIFLSHSGAQKSFVEQLCLNIKRYDRYPFFDKCRDSLPIGCHFPSLIFDAIKRCRVGVVVLSEEFFSQSKWPMLEFVAMVKRQTHDPNFIIMPVFLHIKRAECRKKVNRDRWLTKHWQAWAKEDKRINLNKWQESLEVFGRINGVSLNDKFDEVKCRGEIVEALIKAVPPLTRWDDSHVQGRSRMCVAIRGKIDGLQLSKSYGVKILGLYGFGGIGKTTACMVLCNDYSTEFEGRVCHIEFGVGSKLLRLQEMLRILTETDEEFIKSLSEDKCKDRLKRGMKRKVLLTIDNVSDVQKILDDARDLLRMEFPEGSIVIVTARSLAQLVHLNISAQECLGMPNLEEDDARSLFLYHAAPGSYLKNAEKANEKLLVECIGRCRFGIGDGISYHYHPLALKVLGGQFGNDPEEWVKNLKEVDLFNRYQEDDEDHPIYSILGISYEKLKREDKFLFMDAAMYTPYQEGYDWYPDLWYPYYGYYAPYAQSYQRLYNNINVFDWLSIVYGKSVAVIKERLEGLKNKSLLENVGEGCEMIRMHDLCRGFAAMKAEARDFEQRHWVYEKACDLDGESRLSGGGWECLQRACMVNGNFNLGGMVKEVSLSLCSNLRVLKLWCVEIETRVLDVRSLTQLKSLQIFYRICSAPKLQILGLGCLRSLVYLELNNIEASHEEIWSLTSLRYFVARKCKFGVADLIASAKLQLQTLVLYEVAFTELPDLSSFPRLRNLITSECEELTGLSSSKPLTALEHLELDQCGSLKALPDLNHLVALSYFRVWNCGEVQLTVHEIEKLEAMCPGLQLLFMRGSTIEFYCWEGMFKMNPYEVMEEEPTHLNTNTGSQILVSSTDKLTARYTGDGDLGAIQANGPAAWRRLFYYFEMTVKDQGQKGRIGIGFTGKDFKPHRLPGCRKNGYGYHGDDGMLYCKRQTGEPYAQGFTTGDTVGAGINYAKQEIFFTRNGNILPSVAFKDVESIFYPTIGLGSPKEKVEVNFGQRKFVFDLESTFPEDRGC